MTPPLLPADGLHIPDALLQDLLSALRRHHAGDCTRLLQDWAAAEREWTDGEADDEGWWEDEVSLRYLDDPVSGWVHREALLHVAAGRFEHALCLIENHRRRYTAADMALFNPTGAFQ